MMSGLSNRPILGRGNDFKEKERPSYVSDLFPNPSNNPVWNSAILFPNTCPYKLDDVCTQDDSRSLQQDLPIYKSWSVGDDNWQSSNLDSSTSTRNAASQTEWSFHPKIIIKDPLLAAVSGSCLLDVGVEHLNISKTGTPSESSSSIAWQPRTPPPSQSQSPILSQSSLMYRPPAIYQSPVKSSSPQEKISTHTERRHCVFCKQNGETKEFYFSHVLKDAKGKVVCPTLRDYVCPICGATGSSAHTISYCPLNKEKTNIFRTFFSKVGKKERHE